MIAQTMEAASTPPERQHATFFRQSGWLMVASIVGGLMAFGVHFLSKRVQGGEYSAFGTVLMVVTCLPTIPLQMVFAQQTANALVTNRQRQVASMIRLTCFWSFVLWAVAAVLVFYFQTNIVQRWELSGPIILWITLGTVLLSIWTPIFGGALQGKQDFFWLGWSAIATGVFRLLVAALLVLGFQGGSISMMVGAMVGFVAGLAIMVWRTRDIWMLPAEKFDRALLLRQILPLLLGFWACQFLFTSDTMFAKAFFSGKEMDPYVATGTLSRALLWLVLPLASVMFPKLVHSVAKSEKSNLLKMVLIGTAVLAFCGGIGLWLVGPYLVEFMGKPEWVESARRLLPWYAAAMIALALANVLANDILARGQYKVVPLMVLLAVAYGFVLPLVLKAFPGRLEHILQTLTVFNLLLLAVCAWAAFRNTPAPKAA